MSAWNPGTAHTDNADGSIIVDITDLPTPSTSVSSISNNPAKIVTD